VEYGYYPQSAVSKSLQIELEEKYLSNSLKTTGATYTTNSQTTHIHKPMGFGPLIHNEYEYNGEKFVRVIADLNKTRDGVYMSPDIPLSNGETYIDNDAVWVKVEPIVWLVDPKNKIMVTEKILVAGVPLHKDDVRVDFDKSLLKSFLDNYFEKEIMQGRVLSNSDNNAIKKQIRKNAYNFEFDEVSEEDIIKGAVQSGVAVFLHGKSSDGKSARVKQLDPDCEIIYLRNATPESLNGKSVYNQSTGEMIDVKPTWLKKLESKCNNEQDKVHIVFFDEITNALPSIQGMAFNIVLDREVNGIWKLPENARIVAAGNDLNDSLAANTLAEPLFNRFAHVYINTTIENWLKWAVTPEQDYERLDYNKNEETTIHPAICDFVEECDGHGKQVLRTPYTGEKPNADPRKWEMASKVLYATKQPEMLRALIGEELTYDFVEFCKQKEVIIEEEEEELEI